MGIICKVKIDYINKAVRLKSKLMQWTNTDQVLNWFTSLDRQAYSCFSKFDVADSYPDISEELVIKSLNLGLIRNACKSVFC